MMLKNTLLDQVYDDEEITEFWKIQKKKMNFHTHTYTHTYTTCVCVCVFSKESKQETLMKRNIDNRPYYQYSP